MTGQESTHVIPEYIRTIELFVQSTESDEILYTVPEGRQFIAFSNEFKLPCVTVSTNDYPSIAGTYTGDAIHNNKVAYRRDDSHWLIWAKDGLSAYSWAFTDSCSDISMDVMQWSEVYSYEDTCYPYEVNTWYHQGENASLTVSESKAENSANGIAIFKESIGNDTARPFALVKCDERDNTKEAFESGTVISVNMNIKALATITGIEYDENGMPKVPEKPITSVYVSDEHGMVSNGVYTLGNDVYWVSSEWEGYVLHYNGSNTWRIDSMMGYATIQISNSEGDIHEVLGTKSWTMYEGAMEPYPIEITISEANS